MIGWLLWREFNKQVRRGFDLRQHGWNDPDELLSFYAKGKVDMDYIGKILAKGARR